ncbi:MAG: hypothetical protein KJ737_20480 [Proteobacteria bacterium]|nr:hypothetical protein [Pseudomonadota bacterium]
MSVLKDVLSDEHERLKSLVQWYKQEIASLPKGSMSIKKRKDRKYLYINYREKNKVKSDYVGLVSSEKAAELANKILQRKKYEEDLKVIKKDLKELERALYGKKI